MSLKQGALTVNTKAISYEGNIRIEPGAATRTPYPQVNGSLIVVEDISTKMCKITIPIRVTPETNKTFDEFYNNDDNNVITFRDQNFSGCFMEVIPEREDLQVVDYVFMGNPAV
jgi:hypothetical protein